MTRNRDDNGLLVGVTYPTKENGQIDWRKMLRPEHLYINREYKDELETRFNRKLEDISPAEVEDKQLLILLAGIKELARLRGYSKVSQQVNNVGPDKAVATCAIQFIGNIETDGQPVEFSDVGSASLYSVSGTFQLHLEAIAANRAFVRAVRNFLGVNITAKDEFDSRANKAYEKALKEGKVGRGAAIESVSETTEKVTGHDPHHYLKERCSTNKPKPIGFDALKKSAIRLVTESTTSPFVADPNTWIEFSSIDPRDVFTLLGQLEEAAAKKKSVYLGCGHHLGIRS